jgi:hypothetical protein
MATIQPELYTYAELALLKQAAEMLRNEDRIRERIRRLEAEGMGPGPRRLAPGLERTLRQPALTEERTMFGSYYWLRPTAPDHPELWEFLGAHPEITRHRYAVTNLLRKLPGNGQLLWLQR